MRSVPDPLHPGVAKGRSGLPGEPLVELDVRACRVPDPVAGHPAGSPALGSMQT
jgi:hypothetical protein